MNLSPKPANPRQTCLQEVPATVGSNAKGGSREEVSSAASWIADQQRLQVLGQGSILPLAYCKVQKSGKYRGTSVLGPQLYFHILQIRVF